LFDSVLQIVPDPIEPVTRVPSRSINRITTLP